MASAMEWLLIIMLNLPPEKADIGDLRFPTKVECMAAGEELATKGTGLIRQKTAEGEHQIVVTTELQLSVVHTEIQCINVAK